MNTGKKHEQEVQKNLQIIQKKIYEFTCFDCEQTFKSKYVMMEHRSKEHKEKLKICKNAQNYTLTRCWF